MNLVYGEIVDIGVEDGRQIGSVRVSGATKKVALDLIADAQSGDAILMCDGVAIAKVEKTRSAETSNERAGSVGFCQSSFVL